MHIYHVIPPSTCSAWLFTTWKTLMKQFSNVLRRLGQRGKDSLLNPKTDQSDGLSRWAHHIWMVLMALSASLLPLQPTPSLPWRWPSWPRAQSFGSNCKVLSSLKQKTTTLKKRVWLLKDSEEKVESALRPICTLLLKLLAKYLIANAINPESKVFGLKMKGDYFQYFNEVACSYDQKQMIGNSQGIYQ